MVDEYIPTLRDWFDRHGFDCEEISGIIPTHIITVIIEGETHDGYCSDPSDIRPTSPEYQTFKGCWKPGDLGFIKPHGNGYCGIDLLVRVIKVVDQHNEIVFED